MNRLSGPDGPEVVIVGGGPAGLGAAIGAAQAGFAAVLVEAHTLGGQMTTTAAITNYPGFPDGISGAELTARLVRQASGTRMLTGVGVTAVGLDAEGLHVDLSDGGRLRAPAVVVASGSTHRTLGVPGESELTGTGVRYAVTSGHPVPDRGEVLVVGGGTAGLEEGHLLAEGARLVRIVESGPRLGGSPGLRQRVLAHPRVCVHTDTRISEFVPDGPALGEVRARNLVTREELRWRPQVAFVFVGRRPDTAFLGDLVSRDETGAARVDSCYRTRTAGLFCVGAARAGFVNQLVSSTGEGVAALVMVRQYLQATAATDPGRRP